MPNRDDLPPELRAITRRNALELSDQRWRYDVGRLINTLEELLAGSPQVHGSPASERSVATAPPPKVAVATSARTKPAALPARGGRSTWWAVLGAVAAVVIAVAIVAAISGGGGNDDKDRIASVVETALTSTDPADCTMLYTQAFLDTTQYAGTGEGAMDACRAQAKYTRDDPNLVHVADVEVSGNSATAEAVVKGGLFDGQTLAFSLRNFSGEWKLDQFNDIKNFHLQRFADAFITTAAKFSPPLTAKEATCAEEHLSSMSPNEVKAGILSNDLEQLLPFHKRCRIEL